MKVPSEPGKAREGQPSVVRPAYLSYPYLITWCRHAINRRANEIRNLPPSLYTPRLVASYLCPPDQDPIPRKRRPSITHVTTLHERSTRAASPINAVCLRTNLGILQGLFLRGISRAVMDAGFLEGSIPQISLRRGKVTELTSWPQLTVTRWEGDGSSNFLFACAASTTMPHQC